MTEALIIKCPLCKEWFDRSQYNDEPKVDTCKCGNLTIEVEALGDEEPLFRVSYKEEKPILKMPKVK